MSSTNFFTDKYHFIESMMRSSVLYYAISLTDFSFEVLSITGNVGLSIRIKSEIGSLSSLVVLNIDYILAMYLGGFEFMEKLLYCKRLSVS